MSIEYTRLSYALLLSLLLHASLLTLTFGGLGLGLPGFGFPWQDRRIEAPDLRVVVVPAAAPPVAEPLQSTRIGQPVAEEPASTSLASRAPNPRQTVAAIVPDVKQRTDTTTIAAPVQMPLRADGPGDTALPPIPAPAVIAVAPTDEATWVVPAVPAPPAPVVAPAPSTASTEAAMPSLGDPSEKSRVRVDQEEPMGAVDLAALDRSRLEKQRQAEQLEATRQNAARQEEARAEKARLEAERQEAARQAAALRESTQKVEAARIEAARVEAARVEAVRAEAARVEAARVEAARVEAVRAEAARVEAARVEAVRVEAARVEAARVEAARVEAARVEAARVEAVRAAAARVEAARAEGARGDAARVDAAQEAAARREATLRAIGRQLDEEAARRDAATAAARQSPTSSGARRYRLFGRTDPNAEIIQYAEAWSRKIQLNMTFEMVREAAKQPHTDPVVTVAIRSDGSVESVTFVVSSGVAALDEAIRRVVRSQTPYQVFPPELARDFDVIEVRRTWYFDMAIRLY
jgi:membrane protein involved in colicin uptake